MTQNKKSMKHQSIGFSLIPFYIFLIFLPELVLPLYAQDAFPQRIISLGPALTEELYILGVGDRLLADTVYCLRPPDARSKEKVGTITEINIEKVVSLKPDLVLATSLTSVRNKEKLKNLGIRVVSFSYAGSFSELCKEFMELGKIVGREKNARDIIEKVKKDAEDIRKKAEALSRPKVFIQIGARPLHTATGDSFLNDFIELAGGTNIAFDANSGLYSREMVLKQNPDVIIITTMGIAGESEKRNWERYRTLKAVKNQRIYIIDSYKFCSPTPISFVEGLEEVFKILHPETMNFLPDE